MVLELLQKIESDEFAAEFYLASDIDWLCRWLGRNPEVVALEELVTLDPSRAELLASRTRELLSAPVPSGFRSEYEPALCCYAFVLSHSASDRTREILNELDAAADPSYGWLRRLLDRCLRAAPAATRPTATSSPSVG
jgi:hypothetical protein